MKAEAELDIAKLKELLGKATCGPWRIDRGLMNDALRITAFMREGFAGRDGPICSVAKKRMHFSREDGLGSKRESRTWETPIKTAEADAELIVAAVNALPELIRRASLNIDETGWLIERPADKYGPIRYWAIGEPLPVINSNEATRFARKKDAEAVIRAENLKGFSATEHMWLSPKKRVRDTDGSGEAGETTKIGSTRRATAGAEGIALKTKGKS